VSTRVNVEVGPVPSDIALAWCANGRELIAAVRERPQVVRIEIRDDMLDLCDSLLTIWEGIAARQDPFEWTMAVPAEMLELVAKQWLDLGALTEDELDAIGVSWAPEWTAPMRDAVASGVLRALPALGEVGESLIERIGPTDLS
jgi:hypothetical protein